MVREAIAKVAGEVEGPKLGPRQLETACVREELVSVGEVELVRIAGDRVSVAPEKLSASPINRW